jgi:hypothetical protein
MWDDMLFLWELKTQVTENLVCLKVGANSARVLAKPARTKNPSGRIVAGARMMNPSVRQRRSLIKPFSSY